MRELMQPLWENEGGGSGGGENTGGNEETIAKGDPKDLISRREAQLAFQARDKAKEELRELKKNALTAEQLQEYNELRAQREKAEEERQKKDGQYEALRIQLLKKHDEELTQERQKAEAASTRLRKTLISKAFAESTDWFGTDKSKTILTPEIAEAFYGKYVELDESDAVIVKDNDGNTILDVRTGKPARFADAIGELITSLPNKDHVLRGSGKTGSGSSGGAHDRASGVDLNNLKSNDFRDPKVRAAVKQRQADAGGLQIGRAFDQMAAARSK